MGVEVGDIDGAAAAAASPMAMGEGDPVEALLVGSCEALDLGDGDTQMAGGAGGARPIVNSNGQLTEDEAAAAGPIEPVPEVASSADVVEPSRLPVKNWSDFNAVSAKTFGDQRFGSFSDLLTAQPDFPPDAPPPQPSGASLQLGSDVDFFELGAMGSALPETITSPMAPPEAPVVDTPSPGSDEQPKMSHEELALPAPSPPQLNNFALEQQVAAWSDLPVEEGPILVADTLTETASQSEADPYPGWYWDYTLGQWREVEGYNAPVASVSENHPEAHQVQTIADTVPPVEQAAEVALEQSQAWNPHSAATQTVADEYPGWKWDYAAQTWVATPDYNESSSWQQTSAEAQSSGQDSWYGHQEQQQQQQQFNNNDATNVVSQNENPVASYQQPQSFFFPEYASGSANVMANGYAPEIANPVNTTSGYSQETKQWQGGAAGGAPNLYFPHTHGDQGWPAASAFNNQQEQFASQSMSLSDSSYYNYTASGGSNNNNNNNNNNYYYYLQQNQQQQQQQQQQPWGNNASHFAQYNNQQYTNPGAPPPKNVHEAMRTCSGRPPHSLAAFGFGGKFIFMKHRDPVTLHTSDGDQAFASGEAWMPGPIQVSNLRTHLPREPTFAGPLMGSGSVKELNKWIDERVATQSPYDSSRLLLGVLKVACQHYGKLRSSNVNAGSPAVEEDGPEAALAKLLAGAGGEQGPFAGLASRNPPLRGVPLEQQLQGTALEVKKLLVCGKRKDALKCAQEGELWGIALLIARQLGEKFFCDTVTEMARRQFVSGSPLRTLSLLLAGQPAEVFAAPSLQSGNPTNGIPAVSDQSQDGQGATLDDWQENIAIMAANRTQGDERVMLHLGDRLWGVRGEVAAAHLCYLVADANLEFYSGNARLCLIGADHCKNPRTFVTPEAIQRTEIYEYAKVLGNPQSVLLSFQPYKLVYAEMLVECGNTRDSLKYCQTVLKTLKSAGMRSPEVEACKTLATSLEERLRVHMQDGYGSNLAPRKLVNKIKGTMDWGISKLIGGPPTAPAADSFGYRPLDNGDHFGSQASRPGSSAGQRSGALAPSASIAASMERMPQEANRGPARSQSEPDFGRNAKQGETEGVSPRAAGARLAGLGRLGSNILQRATGLWGSKKIEAKLGDANKFYYDEKLKKWVEEGVDPIPDVAPPPPPPTTSSFMGSTVPAPEETTAPPQPGTSKPGTPPLAPNSNNYYSNRRQSGGVRSRYVDTFNKGGSVSPAKSVMGSLLPPSMPGGGMTMTTSTPSMFVPGLVPAAPFSENNSDAGDSFVGGASRNDDASPSQGPLSDTANSNGNTYTGLGYPPSTYSAIPQVSTADLASFKPESADFSSYGAAPAFGGAHTKSSSWGGYPSSFQNPLISEDGFGTSFSGHDKPEPVPSMPVAQSAYTNFYLPNGSSGVNATLPSPPPLGVVPSTAGEIRDPSRQLMGQQFRASQSVDSLTGEEMQEVEL